MPVDDHRHNQRADTEAGWVTLDPTLANKEVGWITTTGEYVIGDGVTNFSALPRYGSGSTHVHDTGDVTTGTLADGLVAESNVTQHEAALTVTESQVSDLGAYPDSTGQATDLVAETDGAGGWTFVTAPSGGGLTLEEVQDDLGGGFIVGGDSVNVTYDDVNGTLTFDVPAHDHERAPKTVSTSTYTAVLADTDSVLRATGTSGCAITVPPVSSEPFETGDLIPVYAVGSEVTFVAGSGVTLDNGSAIIPVGGNGALYHRGGDVWDVWAPSLELKPITFTLVSGAVSATGTAWTYTLPLGYRLSDVAASVSSATTTGTITVDINEDATSILSTKLTIDAGEVSSHTAATAAVLSDLDLAQNSRLTIDIDTVGDGTAEDLTVTLIGYWR